MGFFRPPPSRLCLYRAGPGGTSKKGGMLHGKRRWFLPLRRRQAVAIPPLGGEMWPRPHGLWDENRLVKALAEPVGALPVVSGLFADLLKCAAAVRGVGARGGLARSFGTDLASNALRKK